MYTEVAFGRHVLDNPANNVIDLPALMIPNGGGKETFTFQGPLVVSCSSFSSTVGLVLVDNWVDLAIFLVVLVLLCLTY